MRFGCGSTSGSLPLLELAHHRIVELSSLLRPAIRYVLTVLARRNPRYLPRLVNRCDEIYGLLLLAVERHYLATGGSSFAENFYGLRRRRRPAIATDRAKAAGAARSGSAASTSLESRRLTAGRRAPGEARQ
ncbi:unnamed protein product [Tilletia laevis]|uniref:Peroxisome assembly protein 12 n=1 Tax=Tilletia laevis TaxID=157183 RepID=A0A9N8LH05_9BASI|nr:unnamed protein product [Tilletia laevis]